MKDVKYPILRTRDEKPNFNDRWWVSKRFFFTYESHSTQARGNACRPSASYYVHALFVLNYLSVVTIDFLSQHSTIHLIKKSVDAVCFVCDLLHHQRYFEYNLRLHIYINFVNKINGQMLWSKASSGKYFKMVKKYYSPLNYSRIYVTTSKHGIISTPCSFS
jgi:hypothetical protein